MESRCLLRHFRRIAGTLQTVLPAARVNVPGTDAIDPDAPGGQVERQISSKSKHRCFGAGVRDAIREGVGGVNRADIHDAASRLGEKRKQFPGQQKGAAQVYVHHEIPICHGEGLNRLIHLHARIVYKYVHAVVKLSNSLHRVLNLRDFLQIHWHISHEVRGVL